MTDTSTTGTTTDLSKLPIDYTSRDFNALLGDFVRRMTLAIPGWEASPSSFEMIIFDQIAYCGDILNFYIDRMAAEAYIQSAVLRESVLNLAYAFGYVPTAQTAATATVTFTRATTATGDLPIAAGTKVYANSVINNISTQVIFETTADVTMLAAASTVDATVREGVTVPNEALGKSSGAEYMQFPLLQRNVIKDSVVFYVHDGAVDTVTGKPNPIRWTQVKRMIDADATDRVFTVYVDENGTSIIRTGDGTTGRIPTTGAAVSATYRYGKGSAGNVPAASIKALVAGGDLAGKISTVTNAAAATGGADAESLQSMRTNIPRSLRALDRAVTLQDYADLAIQVPGVAKAASGAVLNTNVTVAVLGFNYAAPDTTLTNALNTFFNDRKMIGTTVTIIGPTYKNVNVTGTIVVNALYVRATVDADVEKAIAAYFGFDNVDFGFTSKLSDLFAVIMGVPGVTSATVSEHYLQGGSVALNQNITLLYNEFPKVGTVTITPSGGIA